MTVDILFFGATADITGTRKLELDLPSGTNTGQIFERLKEDYPALSQHRLLYSIDQQYASGDEIVHDGDELAVFTAVSGG